jgi:anti-sigma-K factor RskA
MNFEEHDELWELLGKARTTKASPFFARNILRSIREAGPERPGFVVWLRARWKFATLAVSAVAFAAVVAGVKVERAERPDPLLVLAGQVSASPDYQVINHLDELLDSEQNSVWLEASAN